MLAAELNRSRKLGVEYEMTFPLVGSGNGRDVQQALARVLTANGLRAVARGYSHEPLPPGMDLAIEHDMSVQGESRYAGITWHPVEFKTRIIDYNEWEMMIPKALEICAYMGGRINRTCGHHVHLALDEVHQRSQGLKVIRSLYNLMHRFEPVVYGLVSQSRRNPSGYSSPLPGQSRMFHGCSGVRSFRKILSGFERRFGLNLTHVLEEKPHVEFRYHQGTLDVEKARHWLRLCLQLTQHAVTRNCAAAEKQTCNDRKGFDALRYTIGLKSNAGIYAKVCDELKETSRYLLRRWNAFNMQPSETSGNGQGDNENGG